MELRHLRYFLAVAEEGHVTRAAERLGIQQPPLSLQIRALEKHIGMTLFRRHPKGVALTDGGRLFREEAQRIVSDVAAVEDRMGRIARGEQGMLKIGFTSSAAAHPFTPDALRACRQAFPGIRLVPSEDNAANITELVASGRLHCGLIRVPVAQPEGLVFETLLREPVLVAVPSDHPLAQVPKGRRPKAVSLAELRDEQLILVRRPGAPGLYANLLALCEQQGFRPRIAAEVERMMTNLNLVAAGVGISIVPASMQGLHAGAVVYRPLVESAKLDAPLTLVYRAEDSAGPVASFVALTRKVAARLSRRAA
ncbi:MAG: LysR family transcriptional regulator [Burkholderiales bacterium]|nr:LysR family transcriptional regulator [Burkholderiales bacterium]